METHAGFAFTVERKEYSTLLFMVIETPVLHAGQVLQWKKILVSFLDFHLMLR